MKLNERKAMAEVLLAIQDDGLPTQEMLAYLGAFYPDIFMECLFTKRYDAEEAKNVRKLMGDEKVSNGDLKVPSILCEDAD